MIEQPWSNGRVGTTGCSSTAQWQLGVVALNNPRYAAFNAQGFGCGVGHIGPYYEQGDAYRGGVFMMYNLTWFYENQKPQHPMFPPNISQEDLILLSKSWDLTAHFPLVDWSKAYWILPLQDILKNVDGPHGVFADSMPVPGGGGVNPTVRMTQRGTRALSIMTTRVFSFQDSGTPGSMTSRLHRTLSCTT